MKLICEYCGIEYNVPKSYATRRKHHYCCRNCFIKSGRINSTKTKTTYNIKCLFCGNIFRTTDKRKKYCNNKCYGKATRKENKLTILTTHTVIHITYKNIQADCLIDTEDIPKIKNIKIYVTKDRGTNNFYACYFDRATGKSKKLHRLLSDCPDKLVVDHINHNTLDNRKINLRNCTIGDNSRNRAIKRKENDELRTIIEKN